MTDNLTLQTAVSERSETDESDSQKGGRAIPADRLVCVVELEALPDEIPGEVRLRAALKVLLRRFGLKARWAPVAAFPASATLQEAPAADETVPGSAERARIAARVEGCP